MLRDVLTVKNTWISLHINDQRVNNLSQDAHSPYSIAARKYRPRQFSDLIGQEAVVKILTHAIESDRLPHAFILTGIRGVGKTTIARLIARCLNCVGTDGAGKPTITPCGVCPSCEAINNDCHLDVIEMDAASRTGVDDIREVIEAVRYKAVSGRYKIYIIDEVHMLSKSAFNALLKTLEEPPPHAKFIFATTEIRRVPDTILSRCMRFDLKRLNPEHLKNYFKTIAEKEKATIDEEALNLLVKAADGSVRDGLSLLDQAITLSRGTIKAETFHEMLGLVDKSEIFQLFQRVISGEAAPCLQFFDQLYAKGADPYTILQDLLTLVHWLSVLKINPSCGGDSSYSPEEQKRAKEISDTLSIPILTRLWQVLLKGAEEVRSAPSAFQAAQMVLIRLVYLKNLPSTAEILDSFSENPPAALQDNKISSVAPKDPLVVSLPPRENEKTIRGENEGKNEKPSHPFVKEALEAFPGAKVEYLEVQER
jgi:DNA polymerase-3 subunit gamma/tau